MLRSAVLGGRPAAWALLALLCAGCGADARPEPDEHVDLLALDKTPAFRGDAEIVRVVLEAAARERVPSDVLFAIGWAETHLGTSTPDRAAGEAAVATCGVFGLEGGAGGPLEQAARLVGERSGTLCKDVAVEARAAAARLRRLAGGASAPPVTDVDGWLPAVNRWHPALAERGFPYADYLSGVLARGLRAYDASGELIVLPARDSGIGRARAYATPDTPLAEWRGPACDYRAASRVPGDVSYVIIHTCEGGFAGCLSTLVSCGGTEVSAHYVTSYTGYTAQAVEEHDIAWHVGCLNSTSIGIEHEGFAGADSHPDEQYCQSAKLVRSICDRWGIPCDRAHVIGHVEANEMFCHGDHWDPGPNWDWTRFMDYVARGGCACVPDAPEMCNGFDDDCDGVVDEDAGCPVCAPIPAGGRVVEEDGADAPCFEVGGPREYWRDVTGAGSAGHLFWTHTTDDAVVANYGVWRLELEAEGDYLVCAYTDPAYAQSHRAVYQVEHAGARDDVPVDQAAVGGWSEIGRFHFAAGGGQSVRVDDNTGEALATNTQLVADALKVLPAGATDCNADPGVAIESDGGPGSASDGGTTPRDGAVATDGRASGDAGPDMTLSSGCGCVAAGGSDRGRFGWPLVVGAVALALALRARRRR